MCILLKLDYAKFGVSNLLFLIVIEEKALGRRIAPPPPPTFFRQIVSQNLGPKNLGFSETAFGGT